MIIEKVVGYPPALWLWYPKKPPIRAHPSPLARQLLFQVGTVVGEIGVRRQVCGGHPPE